MPNSDLVTGEHFAPRSGSTPDETFRGRLAGRTVEGGLATVIVTRQGLGRDARVWLTFHGAIQTTVVLTNPEAAELCELIDGATTRKGGATS
ncbi:MAG: hypothetical protein ACRDS1_00070 [Pseudonocardiaceae bacterium]